MWRIWTQLLDAMCLVTTHTHVNYKLLVLYRICYRVYTDRNNKLSVKHHTLSLANTTTTFTTLIYYNESRYVNPDSITMSTAGERHDLPRSEVS